MRMAATIIREARRSAGLTQAELAGRLGMTQPAIARLERDDANPTVDTLDHVLRATGHRLQLIAPAWGPSVDVDLLRENLKLTMAERIRTADQLYAFGRRLNGALERNRGTA